MQLYSTMKMEQTVGTADTEIFGKPATVFLLVTTFRIILFKYNKRKDDEVYSFWFDVDLSDDPFHDTEGFLVSHIKTAMPEYGFDESLQRPYFTWHYNFYNPENVKKEAAFIKIFPVKYFYHQKQQFIDVLKPISIPGYKWKGEDTYLGIVPFSGKFLVIKHSPMGTLKMVDLMLIHKSPEFASFHDAGSVPEECPFHESKATRPRESIHVKNKAKKGSSKNIKKEEKIKKPAEKKKEDSLKKAAATSIGCRLKDKRQLGGIQQGSLSSDFKRCRQHQRGGSQNSRISRAGRKIIETIRGRDYLQIRQSPAQCLRCMRRAHAPRRVVLREMRSKGGRESRRRGKRPDQRKS